MLTILGTLKRRPRNATQMSKWPPHADVALWTNNSEFLTYLYEWAFCSVDTTVVCESVVTRSFCNVACLQIVMTDSVSKIVWSVHYTYSHKVENAGNLCGHIKNTLFRQQCRITAKGRKIFKDRSFNCRLFYFIIKYN